MSLDFYLLDSRNYGGGGILIPPPFRFSDLPSFVLALGNSARASPLFAQSNSRAMGGAILARILNGHRVRYA